MNYMQLYHNILPSDVAVKHKTIEKLTTFREGPAVYAANV